MYGAGVDISFACNVQYARRSHRPTTRGFVSSSTLTQDLLGRTLVWTQLPPRLFCTTRTCYCAGYLNHNAGSRTIAPGPVSVKRTCRRAQACLASCRAYQTFGLSRTPRSAPSALCPTVCYRDLGSQRAAPIRSSWLTVRKASYVAKQSCDKRR